MREMFAALQAALTERARVKALRSIYRMPASRDDYEEFTYRAGDEHYGKTYDEFVAVCKQVRDEWQAADKAYQAALFPVTRGMAIGGLVATDEERAVVAATLGA